MRYDVIGTCDVGADSSSDSECPGSEYSQSNLFHYENGES